MIEALTWLEVNKKRLAVAAVAILVLGFCLYVWKEMSYKKEVNASSALLHLRPTGSSPTNQIPVPSADFLKVAQSHAGTDAAERAMILAASALFTEGKYADAQREFDNFIKNHPSSPWVSEAAFGVAASLESQGKQDEALTAYQRVVTSYGSEAVANQSRMAMARIHEAKNQPDQAMKQYEDITKQASAGMTMAAQEAFMRRQELIRKHPELAPPPPTNAPAASIMPTLTATNLTAAPPTNAASTNK